VAAIAPVEAGDEVGASPAPWLELWRNFARNRGALAGLGIIAVVLFAALFAPWLAPHDPIEQFRDALLAPPSWFAQGSARFWLGADDLGRDLLSRLLFGARLSLLIGFVAVALSLSLGTLLGLLAAFLPRIAAPAIMRATDILLALPGLLLAVALVAVLGPGLINTVYAIALVALPSYVRLARAAALSEISKEYVTASRISGAGFGRLVFLTVLPNCLSPLIVQATLGFSAAILDAAALGFLGLGAQPPAPEWGTMLANARDYIERAWWVVTFPGVAILITVLALNLLGDGLRDALDPRLKAAP
jgi:dipeptide transport system permease protein